MMLLLRRHFDCRSPGNCRHIGRELHRVIHIFEVLPRALSRRRQNNDRAKPVIACDRITDFRIAVHGGYGQAAVFPAPLNPINSHFSALLGTSKLWPLPVTAVTGTETLVPACGGALDTPVVNATRSSAPSTLTCIVAFVAAYCRQC